jgi:hypothetical protein
MTELINVKIETARRVRIIANSTFDEFIITSREDGVGKVNSHGEQSGG